MLSRVIRTACVLLLLTAVAFPLQVALEVWGSDLGGPDPPAHFTTGVMVFDYLRTAAGTNPMLFAESYYVRYPKVAFSHWPPVYYLLQSAWYFPFGATIGSARVLSLTVAAIAALLLFLRSRRDMEWGYALLPAAVFLTFPLVRLNAVEVMSDVLVALFVLLAVQSFGDFLDVPSRRRALEFAIWASVAILTKGNAWALGPFALIAPLVAGRTAVFRSFWYWGSGVVTLLLSAPFYLLTWRLHLGYPTHFGILQGHAPAAVRVELMTRILWIASPVVLCLALVGFLGTFRRNSSEAGVNLGVRVAAAWIASEMLLLLIFPLTLESRVYLPSLLMVALLFGAGLMTIRNVLARYWPVAAAWAPVAITACAIATCGHGAVDRLDGFRATSAAIPYEAGGTVMLVGSDPSGEGAFIVERLVHDPSRSGVVLRASKVLAESQWDGKRYRELYTSPAEVRNYLDSLAVRYIVLDESAVSTPHLNLLKEAIQSRPDQFVLRARSSVSARKRQGTALVYENLGAAGRRPAVIEVNLGPERGNRVLRYTMK